MIQNDLRKIYGRNADEIEYNTYCLTTPTGLQYDGKELSVIGITAVSE